MSALTISHTLGNCLRRNTNTQDFTHPFLFVSLLFHSSHRSVSARAFCDAVDNDDDVLDSDRVWMETKAVKTKKKTRTLDKHIHDIGPIR